MQMFGDTDVVSFERSLLNWIGKGKVYPRTGHEGPEGSRGITLLFL
jgi:hypothetical protein